MTGSYHSASDAIGIVAIMRARPEHCRNLDGWNPGICSWMAPIIYYRAVSKCIWGKISAETISRISRDARGFLDFPMRDLIYDSAEHAASPLKASRTMDSIILYVPPQQSA
ncbi:cytochrome P450 82A2 [Colletotrichum graminicola]|nr:cytochrome P450 82A2 [Colletotrichum graminicola]